MSLNKIRRFLALIAWTYRAPPNNPLTGILAVARLLYWTLCLKRVKPYVAGTYLGHPFLFDTAADGCAALYSTPYPEYEIARFLATWLRPGSVYIDIGSNVGQYVLQAAMLGATVHSFEPNPEILRLQRLNLLLNGWESLVHTNQQAVSDTSGDVLFHLQHKNHSLVSSLVVDAADSGLPTTTVRSVTLDAYLSEYPVAQIDLLKVDVEGAEGAVFAGATRSLAKGMVKAIIWETNQQGTQPESRRERQRAMELLQAYGYRHFATLEAHHHQIQARPWTPGDANCVALHESAADRFALLSF